MAIDLLPDHAPHGWLSVSPLSAGPSLVVVIAGEADWGTAPQLREQLIAALAYGPQSLVLDLTDLTFCNSQGLRALLEGVEVAQRTGVNVAMRGMSAVLSDLNRVYAAHRRASGQPGPLPVEPSESRSPSEGARRESSM